MNSRAKFLTFFIPSVLVLPLAIVAAQAQARLTNQSKVSLNGVGQIRVGMTVAEASQAAGTRLVSLAGGAVDTNSSCFYVKPQGGPKDLEIMLNNGRVARVDVVRNSSLTTVKGAGIGNTEARIKSLYPGQIQVTPHKYTFQTGGHYLTFIPKDSADKNYRIVFETDGKRVTQFRAGRLPEVEYVERCG